MNKWTLKKKFSLKHSTISNLLESWKTRRERKIESEPNHQPVFFMSEWCSHTQAKKFANLGEKRFLANHWAKNYDKNKEFINWWGTFSLSSSSSSSFSCPLTGKICWKFSLLVIAIDCSWKFDGKRLDESRVLKAIEENLVFVFVLFRLFPAWGLETGILSWLWLVQTILPY